jgi:hypothetical protein
MSRQSTRVSYLRFLVDMCGATVFAKADDRVLRNIDHSVTFKVADLLHARAQLCAVGVGLENDHPSMIFTDPADTHGLRFGFTASLVDGDPRAVALGPRRRLSTAAAAHGGTKYP